MNQPTIPDQPRNEQQRAATEDVLLRLAELKARNERRMRTILAETTRTRIITPDAVNAYAALHLTTDDGRPIVAAPHHRLWLQFLCDERVKRLLIIAPPESAKTTWVISAYLGTYIGVWPERSVIIGSVSGEIAAKRSQALRLAVESPAWRKSFPGVDRADGMVWQMAEWSLAHHGEPHPGRLHPTVSAYGTGGSVTGARADLVVADDLLDFDNSRTAHQRFLVEQWLHTSLLSRRKSRTGRAVVIGTAWTHNDLYAHLREEGRWIVIHTPLLSETRDVYAYVTYPDDWEHEKLGEPIGAVSGGLQRFTDLSDLVSEEEETAPA